MAFEVSGLNACVQKMKERAVSLIAETFNAPCRMAMMKIRTTATSRSNAAHM